MKPIGKMNNNRILRSKNRLGALFSGVFTAAVLLLFLFGAGKAWGQVPVTIEALSSESTGAAGTITLSHTYNGSAPNRMLLVLIAQSERPISSISTYGGQTLTLVGQEISTNRSRTHIYRLMNPPTGTHSLTITFNGSTRGTVVGIMTLSNVDLQNPHGAYASSIATTLTPTVSPASSVGDLVIDVISYQQRDITANAGQTSQVKILSGSETTGGISTKPGGSPTTTMGWTVVTGTAAIASMSSIAVKPACVVGTVASTPVTCSSGRIGGTITISGASGGGGTYEYRLDAGNWQSSNVFTDLAAGPYQVYIRDAQNDACVASLGTYTISPYLSPPPAFGAASSGQAESGTTVTVSHTTGTQSNRLMLVGVSSRDRYINVAGLLPGDDTPNVTYAGIDLAFVGTSVGSTGANSDAVTYIFMLVNPPTGTANVEVTFMAALGVNNRGKVGVITFSNVDQNNPIGAYQVANGNDVSPSLTQSNTTTNQRILNVLTVTSAATITLSSGQNQRWLESVVRPIGAGYTLSGLSGSTSSSYTLSTGIRWSLSGVAINPMPVADLEVVKTVDHPRPFSGQFITYTLTASNLGCDNAQDVLVYDPLPSGLTYVSHVAPEGTEYNPGGGLWQIGPLADGATTVLTVRVLVNESGDVTNTAFISGDVVDDNEDNDESSVTLVICEAGPTRPLFD